MALSFSGMFSVVSLFQFTAANSFLSKLFLEDNTGEEKVKQNGNTSRGEQCICLKMC